MNSMEGMGFEPITAVHGFILFSLITIYYKKYDSIGVFIYLS